MTRLAAESPRRHGAREFSLALRAAMRKLGIQSVQRLSESCGVSASALTGYLTGKALPSLSTARIISEALADDRLGEIVVTSHTYTCPVDRRVFVWDGAGIRVFCSMECRRVSEALAKGRNVARTSVVVRRQVALYASAVDRFCLTCSPEGLCGDASCPLRAVSPLKLSPDAIH